MLPTLLARLDDLTDPASFVEALSRRGYPLSSPADPRPPDLLLLTLDRHDHPHLELVRELKFDASSPALREVPCVLVLPGGDDELVRRALLAGAEACIVYPTEPEDLVEELDLLRISGVLLPVR
jgi:DNA-binding NarL/FixJ family response regulator